MNLNKNIKLFPINDVLKHKFYFLHFQLVNKEFARKVFVFCYSRWSQSSKFKATETIRWTYRGRMSTCRKLTILGLCRFDQIGFPRGHSTAHNLLQNSVTGFDKGRKWSTLRYLSSSSKSYLIKSPLNKFNIFNLNSKIIFIFFFWKT